MISQIIHHPGEIFDFVLLAEKRRVVFVIPSMTRLNSLTAVRLVAPFDKFLKGYNWVTDVNRNEFKPYVNLVLLDNNTEIADNAHL